MDDPITFDSNDSHAFCSSGGVGSKNRVRASIRGLHLLNIKEIVK